MGYNGPVIPAPGAVTSNLSLWLKANTGVEEGASNPAEDGDVVTSWLDQSASGNDATAVVTPTFATNSVNFNPAVTLLDGSSEYFTVAGLNINPSTTDFSMIAVHRSTNSGDDQVIFSQSGGEDLLALESGSDAMYAEMDNNKRLSTGPNIYDEWNLYGATYSGADGGGAEDLTFYQKGDPDGGQNNITAISETGSWIIGTRPSTADDYWNGEFAELIVYAQDLDASAGGDLHKIESYLAIKYGITLDNTVNPNGDYYTSDATLLWDASANSVYHNDVAGIGRDDGSGLDQQKSISSNTGSVLIMDEGAAFGTDLDFILWGNDGTAATLAAGAELVTGYSQKMTREWKAAVNGSPGTVTVRVILSGNTGTATNYALHVDDDGDFTGGVISNTTGASISGDTITFNAVSIANGNFFTLGQRSSCNPCYAIVDGGNWNSAATWSQNSGGVASTNIPGASDVVHIGEAGAMTVNCAAASSVLDLTVYGTGILNMTADLDIDGDLVINDNGELDANTSSITIAGDWTNNETTASDGFTAGTGTVTFNGSVAQTITHAAGTETFYNLTSDNSIVTVDEGITLATGLTITNNLTMTNGCVKMTSFDIALGTTGTLVNESNLNRVYGTTGDISVTRNISAVDHFNAGGLRAAISTTANMGVTTITRDNDDETISGNTGISLTYDISPATNTGLDAHLHIYYFDAEMTNGTEADFALYKSTDGGSTYDWMGGIVYTAGNSIKQDNLDGFSKWTISDYQTNPLPITLLSFIASATDNEQVVIKWETATEINNDYFTIERSRDGINWEVIAIIDGAGNSSSEQNYTHYDDDPEYGTSYYRLKQTDFDGQYEYFEVVVVTTNSSEEFKIMLFPNPAASGESKLQIISDGRKEVLVVLYDISGRQHFSKVVITENQKTLMAIDQEGSIPSGSYIVVASDNDQILQRKLIVK